MSVATEAPATRYSLAVRGVLGRKWFAADSLATCDRALLEGVAAELAEKHPDIRFAVMPLAELPDLAPAKYRPWDTVAETEDDVNLDELADADL